MPRQSDDEESQMLSDSDYATPSTDRSKCGADRVAFRCMLASQRLELVGFLAQRGKDLQITNLVGGAPLMFSFHRSEITVSSR
jgi:hypothetical protein